MREEFESEFDPVKNLLGDWHSEWSYWMQSTETRDQAYKKILVPLKRSIKRTGAILEVVQDILYQVWAVAGLFNGLVARLQDSAYFVIEETIQRRRGISKLAVPYQELVGLCRLGRRRSQKNRNGNDRGNALPNSLYLRRGLHTKMILCFRACA